ncbi:MAG: 6-carboxytetrahydropterin synthase [Candidatus Krumholzibacteria bacterium]|nr:6-carboxytetrahydropterin synthase [Candidatus Krumholzibacteria bacterium]
MIYLTRKMRFCAAHRLYDPSLSPEANRDRFGECVNLHGHSYTLEVTFAGKPDAKTGMVIHLSDLDAIARERVVSILDHRNLNEDVEVFKQVVPTIEMLAKFVWDRLEGAVPGARLHHVRLLEDDSMFADYYGETD